MGLFDFQFFYKEKKLSKLIIVLDGEPSPGKVAVYGKKREITPFIGIIKRDDGSFDRVVGAKCPNQEKLVFGAVQSVDPLHYIRAFKMLGELKVITDELVQICIQDCVIATQPGSRLENLAKTKVYRECGIYKQSAFEDAQKKAFAFIPSPEMVQCVIDGFDKHLVPLEAQTPSCKPNEYAELSHSVICLEQPEAAPSKADRPCYKPLIHALESSAPQVMPSAA